MPLPGEIAAQPNAIASPAGAASQGLDAGFALAHAKDQHEALGAQLENLKQQQIIQRGGYMVDILDKVSKSQNPKVRGLYLDNLSSFMEKTNGKPMDDSVYDYIKSVPESNQVMDHLVQSYPHFADDPAEAAKFTAGLSQALSIPLADAEKVTAGLVTAGTNAVYKKYLASIAGKKAEQGDRRIENTENKNASQILSKAMNDQPIKDAQTQLVGAEKGLSVLNKGIADAKAGKGTITWGQLHDITSDYASIINAKPTAVVAVAKQKGVEADIPKISAFLGAIERESNQSPSKTVPLVSLEQLKEQFGTLKTVVSAIHDHEVASRLQAGTITGVLPEETANKFFKSRSRSGAKSIDDAILSGYDSESGSESVTSSQSSAEPPAANPVVKNAFKIQKSKGISYQNLSPLQKSVISQKDYDAL